LSYFLSSVKSFVLFVIYKASIATVNYEMIEPTLTAC